MSGNIGWKTSPAIAAAAIAGIFFLFGLITLDDFGVTWDEPVHFAAGDLYLDRILDPEKPVAFPESDFEDSIQYYGPFFDIWGAGNKRILTDRLSLLAEDNARHLHLLLAGALTIYFTTLFASETISPRVGILSGLFLAAFPRFVGHCFNNPKDIPLAFIFVLCLFLFHRRLTRQKRFYSLLLLLAGGVGFATRIQYLIAPLVVIIMLIVYNIIIKEAGRSFWLRILSFWDIPLCLLATIPLGIVFWPYFWSLPLAKLSAMLDFYLHHPVQAQLLIRYLGEDYIPGLTLPWHYVPVTIAVTTPIFTLGAILIGLPVLICYLFRKSRPLREKFSIILILVWIAAGLAPFMLPGQRVYGGIRHFLFVVPALCILAGAGVDWLLRRLRGKLRYFGGVAVSLLFISLYIITYSYHPYYTTYYNVLVGGPRGAFNRFSLENWGNAYKAACRWLNREAPDDSVVLALVAAGIPRWYLRPDITVLPGHLAGIPGIEYDYSIYIMRDYDPLLLGETPVFQITVRGQPICNVHHWPRGGRGGVGRFPGSE